MCERRGASWRGPRIRLASHAVGCPAPISAASPSSEDAEKRRKAQDLLREGGLAVSVQVLQEFYS